MSRFRTDGFYRSGPVNWKDWHAGVHMQEIHYHFWRFYLNGNWVCCHRYAPDFAFWAFTESLLPNAIEKGRRDGTPLIEGGLQLFIAGTYLVEGHFLTTRFEWRIPLHPSGEQVFRSEENWRVLGKKLCVIGDSAQSDDLYFVPAASSDPS
jgi:hypothetical protein